MTTMKKLVPGLWGIVHGTIGTMWAAAGFIWASPLDSFPGTYNGCNMIQAFIQHPGYKYTKYKQALEFIRTRDYAAFLQVAESWKTLTENPPNRGASKNAAHGAFKDFSGRYFLSKAFSPSCKMARNEYK